MPVAARPDANLNSSTNRYVFRPSIETIRELKVQSSTYSAEFGLMKNNRFGEGGNVQFRAEFFNLFNRPNFNLPNNTFDSAQFGRILSAQRARETQFGLKISR